jgi:hypothetical protein
MATVHGLTAGTDRGTWLFEGAATIAVLAVAGLTALRIRQAQRPRPSRVPARPARPAPRVQPAPPVPVPATPPLAWDDVVPTFPETGAPAPALSRR